MAFLPAMAETVQGGGAGGGVGLIKRCSPGTGGVGGLCWCRGRSWLGGVGGKADVPTRAFEPGQEVSLVGGGGARRPFPELFGGLMPPASPAKGLVGALLTRKGIWGEMWVESKSQSWDKIVGCWA